MTEYIRHSPSPYCVLHSSSHSHPLQFPSAPLDSIMPTTCTGSSKDDASCVCTQFIAKKSKGSKCKTCGHRLTSHLDTPAPQDAEGMVTRGAEGVYVNRLFKSLGATAVHEAARKETLQGFRPPPTQDKVCISYFALHFINYPHALSRPDPQRRERQRHR